MGFLIVSNPGRPEETRAGGVIDMAKLAHLIGFSVGDQEYVQSESNWANEISREGFKGPWAKERGFATFKCSFPPILLDLPAWAVVRVFSFFLTGR